LCSIGKVGSERSSAPQKEPLIRGYLNVGSRR
jgi:hypothetical protein